MLCAQDTVMITVCAWCQRLLTSDPQDRLLISHGMCTPCQTATRARNAPVLVVRRDYAHLLPELERLMREIGIPVVLDRRVAQRRVSGEADAGDDRRQGLERRQRADLMVS
jgi:hypothetical protein